MRQSSLLVVNTFATYAGVVVQTVCGILLIRVLLQTLGEYDWGYHAYRAIPIPFCQHLFDRETLDKKIREIGINDLGRELSEPQSLNEWKWSQYSSLFRSESRMELVSYKLQKSTKHLSWILKFPKSFQGRNLAFDDISVSGFQFTMRKK